MPELLQWLIDNISQLQPLDLIIIFGFCVAAYVGLDRYHKNRYKELYTEPLEVTSKNVELSKQHVEIKEVVKCRVQRVMCLPQ
jgi:hypothetical protein